MITHNQYRVALSSIERLTKEFPERSTDPTSGIFREIESLKKIVSNYKREWELINSSRRSKNEQQIRISSTPVVQQY